MKTKVEESLVCCCIDMGAVIDGNECSVDFDEVFADKEQAEAVLATLTAKARKAETEPAQIDAEITETESGVALKAKFTFACQAESLIFQLALR
jgi:uncharacterized protein (TIGR00743 family)